MANQPESILKSDFAKVNPPEWQAFAHDPQAVEKARAAQTWAEKARAEIGRQVQANYQQWMADKTAEIVEARNKPHPELAPPIPKAPPQDEARRQVQAMIDSQYAVIETERQNRINRLIVDAEAKQEPQQQSAATPSPAAPKPPRQPAHPLKKDMHAFLDRVQSVRAKADRHFRKYRDRSIERAKARGAENPVREVYQRQGERLKRIDQAAHRVMHQTLVSHGFDRASSAPDFNANAPVQSGGAQMM